MQWFSKQITSFLPKYLLVLACVCTCHPSFAQDVQPTIVMYFIDNQPARHHEFVIVDGKTLFSIAPEEGVEFTVDEGVKHTFMVSVSAAKGNAGIVSLIPQFNQSYYLRISYSGNAVIIDCVSCPTAKSETSKTFFAMPRNADTRLYKPIRSDSSFVC